MPDDDPQDSDFDRWLETAWDDHAADPDGVAERIADEAVQRIGDEAQIAALAHLVHHLWGEHLGRWADGIAQLSALAAHRCCRADGASGAAVRRARASLALCAGAADERPAMPPSDRIRVTAMAAANLAERDTRRAAVWFDDAVAAAAASGLDATDPVHRAIAVTANNLACTLEEKTGRSDVERDLMVAAATAARRHWALAGGWLETARAEYRLAMTWLQAGDAGRARDHALNCLAIVNDHGGAAVERLFGHEALALAEHAAGRADACRAAVGRARMDFDAVDDGDRAGCRPTVDKLERLAPPTH